MQTAIGPQPRAAVPHVLVKRLRASQIRLGIGEINRSVRKTNFRITGKRVRHSRSRLWSYGVHGIRQDGSIPWLTLLGTSLAVVLYTMPAASATLAYDTRTAHSWLTAFTSHWVHWNGEHLFWSAAAFLLIGALCETRDRRSFVACTIACAVSVPIAVRLGAPHLASYAGLSGVDFGLYTLFCILVIRQNARLHRWGYASAAALLLFAAIAKVAYELATGLVLFVSASTAMAPAPVAHVTAACGGILIGLICPTRNQEFGIRRNSFV